jgi:hypothetical protein
MGFRPDLCQADQLRDYRTHVACLKSLALDSLVQRWQIPRGDLPISLKILLHEAYRYQSTPEGPYWKNLIDLRQQWMERPSMLNLCRKPGMVLSPAVLHILEADVQAILGVENGTHFHHAQLELFRLQLWTP